MPKINVLPKETAELIAAGEVVERPASAIKELVENSIDAGATSITVEIERGGIVMMRVTDNGCGISHNDVPIAFLRHATSKISSAEDLEKIGTLGFRGEALAAISTVARVEMHTKTPHSDLGTRYVIEGGTEVIFEESGCPDGTTIEIRDLFYNTPARMKFLKKDVKEGANVGAIMDRMALSHPEIAFRFLRDGKPVLITQGNGKLTDTVYAVYGRDLALGMIPADYSENGIKVSGLICKPFKCRPNRNLQTVFLNGRFVKSGTAMAALDRGYKNSAMVGKFPYCVLNIEVPFSAVDVNVHPAKTEVRFTDEARVFDCVYHAVRAALAADTSRPQINLHSEKAQIRMTSDEFLKEMAGDSFSISSKTKGDNVSLPMGIKKSSPEYFGIRSGAISPSSAKNDIKKIETDKKREEPISPSPAPSYAPPAKEIPKASRLEPENEGGRVLHDGENDTFGKYIVTPPKASPLPKIDIDVAVEGESIGVSSKQYGEPQQSAEADAFNSPESLRFIGEIFKTYILAESGDKLLLVDKHAAHERIIYEQLKEHRKEHSQMLLTPAVVNLQKDEYSALIENKEMLLEVGFEVEDFGDGQLILRAVPSALGGEDYSSLLSEIAESLEKSGMPSIERLDRIYHTVACKAACKAGSISSRPQLEELMKRAVFDSKIRYCPHGRPITLELTRKELEKMFGRLG